MDAGIKYLMDSISGLVMEVATLRATAENLTRENAALKAAKPQPDPLDEVDGPLAAANAVAAANAANTATFDEHGQATP